MNSNLRDDNRAIETASNLVNCNMSKRGLGFVSGVTFPSVVDILNISESTSSPYCNRLDSAVPVMKFNRRTYKNLRELFSDLWFPIKNRKRLKEVMNSRLISPAFQERLMLAVTAVEGCR